jgi:hypothetical protein
MNNNNNNSTIISSLSGIQEGISDIIVPDLIIKDDMSAEIVTKLNNMKIQADNDIDLFNDLFNDNVLKPKLTKLEVAKTEVKKTEVKKTEVKKTEVKKTEVKKTEVKKTEVNKVVNKDYYIDYEEDDDMEYYYDNFDEYYKE